LYREERGSGAPLLLIHGNGSNTLAWGRTFDDLALGRRGISFDRRGFGRSPGPPAAGCVSAGASTGRACGAIGAAPPRAVFDFALDYRDGGSQFDRFPPEWRGAMFDSAEAITAEGVQLRKPWPSRKAVAGISCPVTIITGCRSEPAFGRAARRLAKILPTARYLAVPNAGHGIHFDQLERFRDEVLADLGT
jgi:pimeloyl-ACP methyl ester carboxylesterase